MIPTDGTVRTQEFVGSDRVEWFSFDVKSSIRYLIEASTLPGLEIADLHVELYDDCDSVIPKVSQNITLTRDIRLGYTSHQTDTLYLKVTDVVTGASKIRAYNLSIYAKDPEITSGAVIIMGSQLKSDEGQQSKINNLARRFSNIYTDNFYPEDRIKFFVTETEQSQHRSNSQEPSIKENLRKAITEWAVPLVGEHQPLILYLVGYSEQNRFYIDELNEEWLAPDELDSWLDQLEEVVPEADINIIIEASNSGSFITGEKSISKSTRMIITSADDKSQAYSTENGAIFSDFFMEALNDGTTLFHSYTAGLWAASVARPWQVPGIDANGDKMPNTDEDYIIASRRGLLFDSRAQTLSQNNDPEAPFIVNLDDTKLEDDKCFIKAMIRDDKNDIDMVWSITYKPGFEMPVQSASLAVDTDIGITTTILTPVPTPTPVPSLEPSLEQAQEPADGSSEKELEYKGGYIYASTYPCAEKGTYRIVVHAKDGDGKQAMPVSVTLINYQFLFLPIISR